MFEPEASRKFSGTSSHFNPILHTGSSAEKQDKDRREGKGHRCYLGDILECRTNHLAARMIWTKVFGRKSIWVGWWFGMVWTGWSSILSKHPFRQVVCILFILFIKIILVENREHGKELHQFRPPSSRDDLCLLFCLYPSSMVQWHHRRRIELENMAKVVPSVWGTESLLR